MKKTSRSNEEYIKALTYLETNGWKIENTLIQNGYGDQRVEVVKSKLMKDGKVMKEKQLKFDMNIVKEIHDSTIKIYDWLISK